VSTGQKRLSKNTIHSFKQRRGLTRDYCGRTHTHTHTLTRCRYQKDKTNLDFTEVRDSEWQWHQLGHMQVCTLLQTDNHASTPPLSFLQAGCPSCRPTNSVKALKALLRTNTVVCMRQTDRHRVSAGRSTRHAGGRGSGTVARGSHS